MARGYVDRRTGPRGTSWFYRADLDPGPDGKRRQTTKRGFKAKKAAEAALNELLHTLRHGGVVPGRLTVSELLDRWLATWIRPKRRVTTYEAYESCVRLHLKPRFGALQLGKLSPLAIETWLAEQAASGLSSATVASQRAILSSALQQAVYWGLLQSNPIRRVRGEGAHSDERPVLSAEQLAALLEATAGTEAEAPILLTLGLGLRRGEIMALRWEDIDLEAATLRVRRGIVRMKGGLVFQAPKTKSSARVLPLGPLLVDLLRRHRGRQAEERLRLGPLWQDEGLLFPAPDGRPRSPSWLTTLYREQARALGLPGTFHDLRHASASYGLAEGIDLKVLSARLGHSKVGTTADIYAHLLPGQQEEASARTEEVLRRALERGRKRASGGGP